MNSEKARLTLKILRDNKMKNQTELKNIILQIHTHTQEKNQQQIR